MFRRSVLLRVALTAAVVGLAGLAGCMPLTPPTPPTPASPRPTAATILEITAAPTHDINATATMYARRLIPSPTPAGLYIVQRGDTLESLASQFGTSVDELMAANGLTDPNALQAGQTLLIPSLISGTLSLGTASAATSTAASHPTVASP